MTGLVRADPKLQHLPSALTGVQSGKLVFAGVTGRNKADAVQASTMN
jgi:hypothetical protein